MTIEEMRMAKERLGYSYEKISELSGVPLGTVQKVFSGITKRPRYDTLVALESIFKPVEKQPEILRERQQQYGVAKNIYGKKQGEYTYEDYCMIPDDIRVELIDGVIYDMASPKFEHQTVAGEIYYMLLDYVKKHKGRCRPAVSPVDVKLDRDEKTVVQPDVVVICDPKKIRDRFVFGAPDLVVEVLSPSTKQKDMYIKLGKYRNAGVREYWMVDLMKQNVVIYDFEEDEVKLFGFSEQIPVGIFHQEGREDCFIDMNVIREAVEWSMTDDRTEDDREDPTDA